MVAVTATAVSVEIVWEEVVQVSAVTKVAETLDLATLAVTTKVEVVAAAALVVEARVVAVSVQEVVEATLDHQATSVEIMEVLGGDRVVVLDKEVVVAVEASETLVEILVAVSEVATKTKEVSAGATKVET